MPDAPESIGIVQRRHVIYVEGYDPQGAEGYYKLFERSWWRFLKLWQIAGKLGPLELDSSDFARWQVEAAGPNWQIATRYDFLRQEALIRANMAEPLRRQIMRSLAWTLDYLVSGALVRVFRASWEFGLVLVHFQMQVIWWVLLSAAGGVAAGYTIWTKLWLPGLASIVLGIATAVTIFQLLRRIAERTFVIQINSHWPYLCEFARGEATCFDTPVETCARHLVAAAQSGDAEEIVIVGHSGGGALAPVIVTRALELDPLLGRRGPPIVLLTLGSIAPGAALHPRAARLRAAFARLAVEPCVTWVDAQSRRDVLNFWDFDPVAGIGIEARANRHNPLIWRVRFRDMLSSEFYERIRFNFFRLHYQFIMANDMRAAYDYFMLIAGPLPVATWARDPGATLARFGADAALSPEQ
ncbi:MAG: hypothetical protein ACJ8F3_18680 [Xanthobacteraceae bacterium]